MENKQCKTCRKECRERNRTSIRASQKRHYHKNKAARYKNWKEWSSKNKEYYNIFKVAKKYDLTIEEYCKLRDDQSSKCFICGSNVRLTVDHNHTTGKIRKLLCATCNSGLGLFKENPESLRKAAEYCEAYNVGS